MKEVGKYPSYKEADFLEVFDPIAKLLARKNTDYGNSYQILRREYGPVAFHIRVADKLNRLRQLTEQEVLVTEETFIDTIKDIIGYCILELLYHKES